MRMLDTCCSQELAPAPVPAAAASSNLVATLNLAGDSVAAPISGQQAAAVVQVLNNTLAAIPGVANISVLGSQVTCPAQMSRHHASTPFLFLPRSVSCRQLA